MEKKIVNNYGSFDVVFVKGEGAVLFDAEGKRYIDFIAGIGVNSLGHNYAPLVEAVQKQAAREIHISNYYLSDAGVAFADELLSATGFPRKLDRSFVRFRAAVAEKALTSDG